MNRNLQTLTHDQVLVLSNPCQLATFLYMLEGAIPVMN